MPNLTLFTYDPRVRQYRNLDTGRFVKPVEVRSAVDHIIDIETLKIRGVAQQLVEGKITVSDWQSQTQKLLKTLHVAMGLAASGGLASTSPSDLGYIASLVKEQYKFLRKFAKQIRNGEQKLDGTLVARAAQYTQASRGTYEQVVQRKAVNGGATECRSILGLADHCTGANSCIEQAAKGWAAISEIVQIGQRKCKGSCKCHLIYR